MPERVSVSEFAARIKSRFPEYNDVDDSELTNRVLARYPDYRDQVEVDARSTLGKVADIAVPTVLRVGGAVVGGTAGAVGGPVGVAAGGALGGGAGELAAEKYEQLRGLRKEINPTQVAVQIALSAIPGGRAASLGRRVLQNAALGATGAAATQLAEGETPSIGNVAAGAVIGGGLGAIPPRGARLSNRIAAAAEQHIAEHGKPQLPPEFTAVGAEPIATPPRVTDANDIGYRKVLESQAEKSKVTPSTVFGDPTREIPPTVTTPSQPLQLKSFPEEVRPHLEELLSKHSGFATQRRNVQTWERTRALSERIGLDLSTTTPKGKVLNAEEQGAFGSALTSITSQLDDLLNRNPATLSDVDKLKITELRAQQVAAMSSLWGSVTETGRALNFWKATKAVMESHDSKFIREALHAVGGDEQKLADVLRDIKDPIQRYEFVKANRGMSTGDKVKSFAYANMLSSLPAHEKNFLSNSTRVAFDLAADALSGRPRVAYAKTTGMIAAVPRAAKEFTFYLKNGFSRESAMSGAFDTARAEFSGGWKNPFNDVSRLLEASDLFTFTLLKNGELYQRAYREAVKEGARGPALAARMAELRALKAGDWAPEAEKVATDTLFRNSMGPVASAIRQAADKSHMWPVVPFIKIASNLTKAGIEASPVGLIRHDVLPRLGLAAKAEGRLGELQQARARLGSALLSGLGWLMLNGSVEITSDAPRNPGERELFFLQGKQPNSIRVGDRWYDYSQLQPLAFPMMSLASFFDAAKGMKKDDKQWDALATEVVFKTANAVLNQSFLSGLSGVYEALSEPTAEAAGRRVVSNLAMQFTPFSGLMRNIAQAQDRTVRQPSNIIEAMKASIPGLSESVEPRLDAYGRPVQRTSNPLLAGFGKSSPVINDPVTEMLVANEVPLARASRVLTDAKGQRIPLSPQETTALEMARATTRRADLEKVARRADGQVSEHLRDLIERAKSRRMAPITARARRMKKRGEDLAPQRMVISKALVDHLYEQYLQAQK